MVLLVNNARLTLCIVYFVGFTGVHCESDVDECGERPCYNGGICTDMINDYTCHCPDGFVGKQCEINVDDCVSAPCRHGGVCKDSIGGYTCDCPKGFSGKPRTDDCCKTFL